MVGCNNGGSENFGETEVGSTAVATEAIDGTGEPDSGATKDCTETAEPDNGGNQNVMNELKTVKFNSSTPGVKILGVRNLASSNSINCDWSCSGIVLTLNCKGTVSFQVVTAKSVGANMGVLFRAFVDGEAWINHESGTPYYAVSNSGQIQLTNMPSASIPFV